MNGTDLDEQLDIVGRNSNLRYEDISAFCRIASINREIAFSWARLSASDAKQHYLREKARVLESKIEKDTYDEEAIQIATLLSENMKNYFTYKLFLKAQNFEKAVKRQILKYRGAERVLKLIQQFLQLAVIIGAASVPFILNNPTSPREVSTFISIIVAASAAILKFYKFQDHINFQHEAAEKMDLEYSLYSTHRGDYKGLGQGAALDRLMDEIDTLRQETNELSLSIGKSEQDQKQDQIQKLSKSTPEIDRNKET
jgi:hypothetical protein